MKTGPGSQTPLLLAALGDRYINITHVILGPEVFSRLKACREIGREAGEGNLEILVTAGPGNNIPTRVEPLGGARFNVTFSPRTADTHSVVVTFNDEPVRGTKITETRATLSPVPGSLFLESETRNYRMSSPRV